MKKGWTEIDGKITKQVVQSAREVDDILDANHAIRMRAEGGGLGSKNAKWVARVPAALDAQWTHEWRQKGGLAGTGMKCREYCLLQASHHDYAKFVVTPSGKTGLSQQANRLMMGVANETTERLKKQKGAKHIKPVNWKFKGQ